MYKVVHERCKLEIGKKQSCILKSHFQFASMFHELTLHSAMRSMTSNCYFQASGLEEANVDPHSVWPLVKFDTGSNDLRLPLISREEEEETQVFAAFMCSKNNGFKRSREGERGFLPGQTWRFCQDGQYTDKDCIPEITVQYMCIYPSCSDRRYVSANLIRGSLSHKQKISPHWSPLAE